MIYLAALAAGGAFLGVIYGTAAVWPHLPQCVQSTLPPLTCVAILAGMLASLAAGNG